MGKNWKTNISREPFRNVGLKSGKFKILLGVLGDGDKVELLSEFIKEEASVVKQPKIEIKVEEIKKCHSEKIKKCHSEKI